MLLHFLRSVKVSFSKIDSQESHALAGNMQSQALSLLKE